MGVFDGVYALEYDGRIVLVGVKAEVGDDFAESSSPEGGVGHFDVAGPAGESGGGDFDQPDFAVFSGIGRGDSQAVGVGTGFAFSAVGGGAEFVQGAGGAGFGLALGATG